MRRKSESTSSIATYEGCGQRYAFKYRDRLPDPSSPAAELGTLFHNSAYASWHTLSSEHPDSQIAGMLKALYAKDEVRALPHPQLVKGKTFEYNLTCDMGGQTQWGFVDLLLDDVEYAADFKTSGKPWDEKKVLDSFQHLSYTYGLRKIKRSAVKKFLYIVVTTSKNPQCQVISLDVDNSACEKYARENFMGSVIRIALDMFIPTPTPRMCGWCNYKAICPAYQ